VGDKTGIEECWARSEMKGRSERALYAYWGIRLGWALLGLSVFWKGRDAEGSMIGAMSQLHNTIRPPSSFLPPP